MKKQSIKNKVKNKNTNRINVINTIKIGNKSNNRKERTKNVEFQTPIETPYKTRLQSPPATRSRNVHLNSPLDTTPKVRNPLTGRMVRIGSATYRKLKADKTIP